MKAGKKGRIIKASDLAAIIDHTLLKPNATVAQIEKLCAEALEFGFWAVCVNSMHIARCKRLLANSPVKVCAVAGFPLGGGSTATKAYEAADAESLGADEIDMVINISALKDGESGFVHDDIASVVNATSRNIITKVILENCYLTKGEKMTGCKSAMAAGADFVKTSTGFGPSGASVEDVALMRKTVGDRMGVKAAGGIRDLQTALRMIEAGATRIGTSSSVRIIADAEG
jgi:deoxyribose-phosphate aldolase